MTAEIDQGVHDAIAKALYGVESGGGNGSLSVSPSITGKGVLRRPQLPAVTQIPEESVSTQDLLCWVKETTKLEGYQRNLEIHSFEAPELTLEQRKGLQEVTEAVHEFIKQHNLLPSKCSFHFSITALEVSKK